MNQTPLIALDRVSQSFDEGRVVALREVSLRFAEGESVAVFGPSGSGKSTIIHALCGIRVPEAGSVTWRGAPVTSLRQWTDLRRSEIGIVFQEFNLFPTLTVAENVEVAMFGSKRTNGERRIRVDEMLEAVGLTGRRAHVPAELSGGERQRVAIARALINGPKLLLADEPTGNLDSVNAKAVLDLLFEVQRKCGASLVMVSHAPEQAALCDRHIDMKDGRVVGEACP